VPFDFVHRIVLIVRRTVRILRMSSDNVFDQVKALIASDERQGLPQSVDAILQRIAKLPLAGPIVWATRYESEKQRAENSELMITPMWEELKRISFDFEQFREDHASRDEVGRLVVDGMRKAEDLRDRKRVERIGKILAHSISLEVRDFDKAEEMMRIARDLSDQDVLGLRYLYDTQFIALQQSHQRINVDDINKIWRQNPPNKIEGVLQAEHISILLKLQGFGLATSVERRETQIPPNEQVFALLPKGADFVLYIQGTMDTDAAASTK